MSDYTLAIRLTGDAGGLVGEVKLSADAFEGLERKTKDTAQASRQAAQSTDRLTQSQSRNAGEARKLNGLYKTLGATLGGISVTLLARQMHDIVAAGQDLDTRIKGLVGSSAAFAAEQSYLYQTSKALHQDIDVLTGSYSRMLSLQKSGIVTQEESRLILEGLSEAAVELAASNTQVQQVMYGLSQAMASPIVRAEELNQAVEPLPGLLAEMDRAAQLPAGGFRQMVIAGEVTSDFFKTTLIQALQAYEGAAERAGGNLSRIYADIGTEYKMLVRELGAPLEDELAEGLKSVEGALISTRENIDSITTVAKVGGVALTGLIAAKTASALASSQFATALKAEYAAQLQATIATRSGGMFLGTYATLQVRATAADRARAVSLAAMSGAAKMASGSLALLGGPAGLIIAGATALALWASSSSDAAAATENYAEKLALLEGNLKKAELAQLNASIAAAEQDRQALQERMKGTSGGEYVALFNQLGDLNRYQNAAKRRAHELALALKEAGAAAGKAGDDVGGAGDDVGGAAEQLDKYVAKLRDQYATLGMNEKQLLKYNTAQVIAGQESSDAAKEAEKLTRQILKKKATLEAEAATQEKLNDLLDEAIAQQDAMEKGYDKRQQSNEELVRSLAEELSLLQLGDRERAIEIELRKLSADATDEQRAAVSQHAGALYDAADAARVTADEADPYARAWEEAVKRIDESFADAWKGAFDSFSSFADSLKNAFQQLLAEMAHQAITKPILVSLGLGSTGSVSAAAAGGADGGGGGVLSKLTSLINGNSIANSLNGIAGNLGLMNTPAGFVGPPAPIFGGSNLAVGASGLLGGFAADKIFGGKNSGLLGGLGSSLGFSLAAGSAASGGMMASMGMAAGPVGAIAGMVIGGLLGKIGGKPSDKTQWAGFTGGDNALFAGGADGEKFSQENRDAATQIAQALNVFNVGLDEFGAFTESLQVTVGSRDGIIIRASDLGLADQLGTTPNGSATLENATDIYQGSNAEAAMDAAFDYIWDKFLDSTDRFSESMLTLMSGLADPDERLAAVNGFGTIQALLDGDVFADYASAVELANRTLWDVGQDQYNSILDLTAAYDGSISATQELAAASVARYQTELALLQQIDAAAANTDKLFSASREQFELAGLNNEEVYNYWKNRADSDAATLATLIDPAKIEQQIKDIDREYRAAWSVLNDEQQVAKAPEYLAYIDELEALRDERLGAARERIDDESAAIARETNQAIAAAAERFVEAARRIEEAAAAISTAASTPVPVTVNLGGLVTFDDVGGS